MLHFLISVIFFELSKLLGFISANFAAQLFIMPIGLITISIPLAPGGIGVGHVAFDYLYHLIGEMNRH